MKATRSLVVVGTLALGCAQGKTAMDPFDLVGDGGASTGGAPTGGSTMGGTATGGANTGGLATGGAETGGASTGGSATGGASTGGSQTGGTSGSPTGGTPTGGRRTGGTGGDDSGGSSSGGQATGGRPTGGTETGGTETGGTETGGTETGGTETGGTETGGTGGGGTGELCEGKTITDLGPFNSATGVQVSSNGCARISEYPTWWDTQSLNLGTRETGSYPVDLVWEDCQGQTGDGTFAAAWTTVAVSEATAGCDLVFEFSSEDDSTLSLVWQSGG
ncbi:MAG: hypothetical protein JW751_06810 [Polyangiaceae bacterium]|nr:hypothetical protein [Polyangiaceae bacterium]